MTTVELLTIDEVSERLRVSRRTVERLLASGRIRAIHIGSRVVIKASEVEAFLSGRRAA